ncbi:hypothetical protein XH80_07095 [Bradyrhizobium sp. CCBAU 45384]|nr:hypothetical protein [Bradyrhizobium sp. CCBAU 45384]
MAKAEVFDQRDRVIRHANADVAARKPAPFDDADVQPQLGQSDRGRASSRSCTEDDDIMLGGKFHVLVRSEEING